MTETNAKLERLARTRVEARRGLFIHVALYLSVHAALVGIWALTGAGYPWFLWPMLGWGIGVVSHVLTYLFGPDSPGAERAVARELHRLEQRPH